MKRPHGDLAAELAEAEQRALGDLTGVAERLARFVAPAPTAEETAALLARLRPLVAARAVSPVAAPAAPELTAAEIFGPEASASTGRVAAWLRLAWLQTSLLRPAFWWAMAAVALIGCGLALVDRSGWLGTLVALTSPLLAVAGVAYAFRPGARATWELEKAAPIQPLELMYARLALVLAGNLVVALPLLAILSADAPSLALWRLLAAWLGAMLGLAGTALYATVRWGALSGGAVPMLAWASLLLLLGRTSGVTDQTPQVELAQTLLRAVNQSNALLLGCLAALALGLVLMRLAGRALLGEETR